MQIILWEGRGYLTTVLNPSGNRGDEGYINLMNKKWKRVFRLTDQIYHSYQKEERRKKNSNEKKKTETSETFKIEYNYG